MGSYILYVALHMEKKYSKVMNIVIIANFPSLLDGSTQGRFINIATLLYNKGHNVEMIVSDFDHSTKTRRVVCDNKYMFKLTYLHEVGYPNNVHPKRLLSHYVWGVNVKRYMKRIDYKPDVVYAALPTFTAGRMVGKWCNKNRISYIIDVQDLWPEAFKVTTRTPFLQLAFKPMGWMADAAYKTADYVVGVSDTYCKRALKVNTKVSSGLTIYLGNNGERFDIARDTYKVAKPSDEFWIAYIGTMGYSYDIKCAIDAIKIVNDSKLINKFIKFVAMGGGPLLNEYMEYASKVGIPAEFTGALPYEMMVGKMCSCDAVVNCLRPCAAQSITNKVGDYALSGLPVINNQENQEYRDLVDNWKCGLNCECGNPNDLAKAIIKLVRNESLRSELGRNSRKLGNKLFDRRITYPRIIELIENSKV